MQLADGIYQISKTMATSRMYGQRLARDVAELYNHDFRCNSSNVIVRPFGDSSSTPQPNLNVTLANGNGERYFSGEIITFNVCIFEGPFRSGQFQFEMLVPTNYPFKSVEVRASHPIWHPNIDLQTGKLSLPQEWSPVLNLVSLTVSVQVLSQSDFFSCTQISPILSDEDVHYSMISLHFIY